jgi:hypothetical protein
MRERRVRCTEESDFQENHIYVRIRFSKGADGFLSDQESGRRV